MLYNFEQARGQGEKFYGGFLKAFNSKYAEFAGEEGATAMREKLKNAKTEDGSFTKLTEQYASEKELVAKMNEDFDKIFEETYKAQYEAYKAIGEKKEAGKEGGGSAPLTVPTLSDVQSTYQSKKAEAVNAVEAYYANVMENATAENTQKYTKEKNDLMRAFKLGYWKGYESGKKAGFAFYAGFLVTIKEMGAFANAPEKLASFEASKAAITKEFADFKYAEEADYKEGAKKAADYELGIKTANSLKAQGLEVPDTLLLPNLEIVSKSVADGRKFGTRLWKNPYRLLKGLPMAEAEGGDATKEVAPLEEHLVKDKETSEKLVAQDLKKMYSDKYVYFQIKALAAAKATAGETPIVQRAKTNLTNILARYQAYLQSKENTETANTVAVTPVALQDVINQVTLYISVAHLQANDSRLLAYQKLLAEAKNLPETDKKSIELRQAIKDLTEPAKTEATEIDTNVAIKPEDLAAQKAKLAEKEQEAIEQDRKDFEIGYLEALEQAKTGKDADGKKTDNEAVEKIAENLGYMSGFVAKLAELGEAGDKNKSNKLIQDFVDNLKDDVLYDKTVWENASKDLSGLKNNINNFVLPAANQAIATTEAFKKAQEKGFAEGKTDGFTSYQIYAVGNSKLKTDVKMEAETAENKFVKDYFSTHAKDFAAIVSNLSNNNLVNYWRTKMDAIRATTSEELAANSSFKTQFNEPFFKGNLQTTETKPTEGKAKPEPVLSFELSKEGDYWKEKGKFIIDFDNAVPVSFDKAGNIFKALKINFGSNNPMKGIQIKAADAQDTPYLAGNGILLSKNPPQNSVLSKAELKIPKESGAFYPNFKKLGIDEKKVDEALVIEEKLSLSDKDYKKSLREVQKKLMQLANTGIAGTKIENIGNGANMETLENKTNDTVVKGGVLPNKVTIEDGDI